MEEKEKHLTEEETSEGLESTETLDSSTVTGSVKISEEVIAQIATQALLSVKGVQPASPGLVANLRLGKKSSSGVKISVHDGEVPSIAVEAYV
ncbi:MAG TPA: Asp23/Gls24 family envelope stress response protein, partial [Thermovirga lienii]|nr:Asp23/Gls24 family envelope stress response protein [Thermovirga lienii]